MAPTSADEFLALLAAAPQFDDLERAVVLVGLAFDPSIAAADGQRAVDDWLNGLAADCPADFADLAAAVIGRHDLRGDREDYYNPANSMLHQMPIRRRGIPLSLGLVVAFVGRRLGVSVDLVGLPGHVMVRSGERWTDPFSGAAMLSTAEALNRWRTVTGQNPSRLVSAHLRAMTSREVVVRMLNNLTAEFARRDDPFALSVAVRIRQAMAEYAGEGDQWRRWQSPWN